MMKIRLIKGCPVNGSSVCTNCESKVLQDEYFDSFDHIEHEVNTVRMGEPFRIADSIEHLMGYNYGYITYEDGGFRYYFYVADLAMITETQTEIRYNLDPYEITCFQGGLEVTRAYVTRCPTLPADAFLPSEPYEWVTGKLPEYRNKATFVALVSTTYGSVGESTQTYTGAYLAIIPLDAYQRAKYILNGQWLAKLKDNYDIMPSDIYGAWVVPFEAEVHPAWVNIAVSDAGYPIYRWDGQTPPVFDIGFTDLKSTIWFRDRIVDARGTPLYECPVNKTMAVDTFYEDTSGIFTHGAKGVLDFSAGSASVRVTLKSGNDVTNIMIPCENADIFADSWAEYYYRSRDADKALRSLGRDETAIKGVVSSAGQAVGSSIGSPNDLQRAGGNFAGDVISTLGEWAVGTYYDPKYQEQYDRKAKDAVDPVLLSGSMTLAIFWNNRAGKVSFTPDAISKTTISDDINTYGYPCNIYCKNEDPRVDMMGNHLTGPIKGAFDFKADCPEQWIDIIEQRYGIGVMMVNEPQTH